MFEFSLVFFDPPSTSPPFFAASDRRRLRSTARAPTYRGLLRRGRVAEAAVAVVKVELVAQAQEKMGLVAAAGRAQAAPAAAAEAEMAPEPAWRPASARARSAWCSPSDPVVPGSDRYMSEIV